MNKLTYIAIGIIVILLILIIALQVDEHRNTYDIIIVGSGLAGLTAAHEAYKISEGSLRILLLEGLESFGGNSKKATSGINLLKTPAQYASNINDSYEEFYQDTLQSSGKTANENLISTLIQESENLFLNYQKMGVNLSFVSRLGGHSKPRTHRPIVGTVGFTLTARLFSRIAHESNIEIKFNTTLLNILFNNGHPMVEAVEVRQNGKFKKIFTRSVILATGGFAHDFNNSDSLLKEFAPNLTNFPSTNGVGSQGSGMKIARKIGAKLVDMDKIQIHPTGFVNISNRFEKHKILAPELLRGLGAILINQKGERFCNELGLRDEITNKILENCDEIKEGENSQREAYIIFNEEGVNKYGKDIKFYIRSGLLKEFANVNEISAEYQINKENLIKTLIDYNKIQVEDKFGKKIFDLKFDFNSTIYIGIVTPSLHYTMGGIAINEYAEVISIQDQMPIDGLFAAGEVTGGLHGKNRLGGNSLLECAVFGKKAAESAISYLSY